MIYKTRPLSDRTWLRPAAQRKSPQFDATWTKTLNLLGREISLLGGRDLVIEVDVREQDIRLDGGIRANASAHSPAVVVAFDSTKHGPMLYRADRYSDRWSNRPGWQANVRAVALTLESLRAVDRYGATETGQQYAGFKALPAGRATPASHMTSAQAVSILAAAASVSERDVRADLVHVVRRARAFAHPDRQDGDRTLWDQVAQAANALGVTP